MQIYADILLLMWRHYLKLLANNEILPPIRGAVKAFPRTSVGKARAVFVGVPETPIIGLGVGVPVLRASL